MPNAAWLREQMLDAEDELPEDSFKCNPLWEVMARSLSYMLPHGRRW